MNEEAAGGTAYTPPLPSEIRANPIRNLACWQAMRDACLDDPGAFHGGIVAKTLHWYHPDLRAWLTRRESGAWQGWSETDGRAVSVDDWTPWETAFDGSDAPFYRWFSGGLTNAAFNEVDRHVIAGHGAEIAYYYEGDRWDATANGGRGGPVHAETLSRRELLIQSVVAARALKDLGLRQGDRIALNMPNILDQIVWTEAAKRLGIIYTAVFGGFSDKTLSDRIEDAGARVVITADGASRNAEVVPYKEIYSDPALDRFVSAASAPGLIANVLEKDHPSDFARTMAAGVRDALAGEITVTPAEIMTEVGKVMDRVGGFDAAQAAELRADLAKALSTAPSRVDTVIVVRHVGLPDMAWTTDRDVWAHDLLHQAGEKIRAEIGVENLSELGSLPDKELWPRLNRVVPCVPVDAEFPLFIIYTSGSTGKPKGVVHVHGGYVAGVTHTLAVSFDAVPGRDVMYVVADPGWITGQSYLVTASLAGRIPGIIAEGAPVFPNAGRFSSIIERYGVTIFKAGVTFLKTVMTNPQNRADVERHDMSTLKVATFCAEPTSPAVQQFGMDVVTRQYINSYWATEHGGIVWTHPYGNPDQRLRADARTYPLPWIMGDVWVPTGEPDGNGRCRYRRADLEEKGEIVVTAPYPYLARTIWGDAENVGSRDWKGDHARFVSTYFGRFRDDGGRPVWAYLQGDFARRYADGSFSLHGRSDDVINVSGHRLGTEEIEGAILKDKQLNPDSPVGNCIVVGAPHREKGLTPLAFVVPAPGRTLSVDDERRLSDLVRQEKGAVAVPSNYILLSAFPETRSGKYMRRFLTAIMLDEDLGDTSTLRNPECLPEIKSQIRGWKHQQTRAEEQSLFEAYRFLRIQYDPVGRGKDGSPIRVATITIANPPVNALAERVLDELDTVVTHIARRDDIGAVVVAGAGANSFVAGADIRQLLEDVHDLGQARALPAKAHAVFSLIERLDKPVVAAVQGVALGGGCELSMACHYRVGDRRTHFGQPEINLFLPPGYGGTQRLPRLLMSAADDPRQGLSAALAILLSGRRIDGEEAWRLGLLDQLTADAKDPLSEAQQLAREAALTGEGPLSRAMRKRHDMLREWRRPGQFPAELIATEPYLRVCLDQARDVGRGKVADAIVGLVKTGLEQGFDAGLLSEIDTFAAFVLDPEHGGKQGIALFLDKKSPPLPARRRPAFDTEEIETLERTGGLLSVGRPFFPGITPLPRWQYAQAVVRDERTGAAAHASPSDAEVEVVVPVPRPDPNQALVFVLASEVNYNDIWAITGIPVSLFDEHDEDIHVTGSGGVGLVAALGEALRAEGRLRIGELVGIYSGVSDLLDPRAGDDPMFTDFHIQGYQSPDGSHQQFMIADGPQLFAVPADLALEAAASYMLPGGTVYRAMFNAMRARPGRRLLVEGAATGTGAWAVEIGLASRQKVTGIVSSLERGETVRRRGARAVNRREPAVAGCFTKVPAPADQWAAWEAAGAPFLDAVRAANDGELVDYAVSHAGETAFPRSFQALAENGALTFFGASSGYQMTFIGKAGSASAEKMLERAAIRVGEAVLVFYGSTGSDRDRTALAAIEAAREAGGSIAVVTDTDAERDFVLSLGYGDAVRGAVSLAEIGRRVPDFEWPDTLPDLPDPQTQTAEFKEAVRLFNETTFKPLGGAIGRILRSSDNPRGVPDIVFERSQRDSLAVSCMLVRPHSGRVVYADDMGHRRYSFYAPQVWMRQRRILMPTAAIIGSHLCNAAEIAALNRMIDSGAVRVPVPFLGDWSELPRLHQAMWENRLPEMTGGASKAVANHALPEAGIKSRDELFAAWAAQPEN